MDAVRRVIPPLTTAFRKGQHGRIGVVGGSFEYTGAPFYAGIAALKTGADLCHIFCTAEAAIPIKSYSPELIVHPLLRSDASLASLPTGDKESAIQISIQNIVDVFSRLDVLIIGPGLGRDGAVQTITRKLIERARSAEMPIVVDGDALFLASLETNLVEGYIKAILTPNAMEYARLCSSKKLIPNVDPIAAAQVSPQKLSQALGYPVVVRKGIVDEVSDGNIVMHSDQLGCPRRCGGQGDVLTGIIATFASWITNMNPSSLDFTGNPLLLAAFGGSVVTRASSMDAFSIHHRSMTTPDILHSIGKAFQHTLANLET